jgi:hypothetical protein
MLTTVMTVVAALAETEPVLPVHSPTYPEPAFPLNWILRRSFMDAARRPADPMLVRAEEGDSVPIAYFTVKK